MIDCTKCAHYYVCREVRDGYATKTSCDYYEEERPQGEWKNEPYGYLLGIHKCSNCGFYGNQLWHFCPSCGLKMVKKEGKAE